MTGSACRQRTLLADLGGTNVRFGMADASAGEPLEMASVRAYRVADFASLADAVRGYFHDAGTDPAALPALHAVFAVAGRVVDDEVRMTNHPWQVSAADARQQLGLQSLHLVNDFAALGMGLALLSAQDLQPIGMPCPPGIGTAGEQTFAVIGAGTGLGVGALLIRDGIPGVLQTEGGHAGFAPRNALEIAILQRLRARFGRVSNERLMSGEGLLNLHSALGEIDAVTPAPLSPEQIIARADTDPACARTVATFCEIYGAIAGDLVLGFGAWDGVYLAGGLSVSLLPWLRRGGFRQCFEDKGRFAAAMARVATLAIVHPYAGLLGAAAVAVRDAGGTVLRGNRSADPSMANQRIHHDLCR